MKNSKIPLKSLCLMVKTFLIVDWFKHFWSIFERFTIEKGLFHQVTFGDETIWSRLTPWGHYAEGSKKYSHPRWLPRRREPRGVILEDYVVWVFTFGPSPATVSVYIWTQLTKGTCTECLHLDPAQLQQHHPQAPQFHRSQADA